MTINWCVKRAFSGSGYEARFTILGEGGFVSPTRFVALGPTPIDALGRWVLTHGLTTTALNEITKGLHSNSNSASAGMRLVEFVKHAGLVPSMSVRIDHHKKWRNVI